MRSPGFHRLSIAILAAYFPISIASSADAKHGDKFSELLGQKHVNTRQNENEIVYWRMSGFWAGYASDGRKYARIEGQKKSALLWDINNNIVTPWLNGYLKTLSKLPTFLNGPTPLVLQDDYSIWIEGSLSRYAPSFSHYVSISKGTKLVDEFYVVTRASPDYIAQRFCCESTVPIEVLREAYRTPFLLDAEMTKDGKVLLFVALSHSQFAIRLVDHTDKDVSVQGDVYVIPKHPLSEELSHAGESLRARYAVILRHLQMARPAVLEQFGPIVSPADFFSK